MIKYLISLLLGLVVGAAAFLALLYFNPLTTNNRLSPLSVSDDDVITFNYSAVATDALVFTNNGESQIMPHPAKVLQLWEPTVGKTDAMVTILSDSRNMPAAIGVKFSSDSEQTRVLNGQALVDSVWHIYMPGQGSLFVEQQENYWSYLRDIVIPARWSSGNSWRGNWNGNITSGPGALGTGKVFGASGRFDGLDSNAVESLNAKAYTVDSGPVAMSAELAIEIPRENATLTQGP